MKPGLRIDWRVEDATDTGYCNLEKDTSMIDTATTVHAVRKGCGSNMTMRLDHMLYSKRYELIVQKMQEVL